MNEKYIECAKSIIADVIFPIILNRNELGEDGDAQLHDELFDAILAVMKRELVEKKP